MIACSAGDPAGSAASPLRRSPRYLNRLRDSSIGPGSNPVGSSTHPAPKRKRTHKGPFIRFGGEGGIRTHDTLLTHTRFPSVRLQPLSHFSGILYQAWNLRGAKINAGATLLQLPPVTAHDHRRTAAPLNRARRASWAPFLFLRREPVDEPPKAEPQARLVPVFWGPAQPPGIPEACDISLACSWANSQQHLPGATEVIYATTSNAFCSSP